MWYRFCYSLVFYFKQKTAYEMRISDWSSDVCSSDLGAVAIIVRGSGVNRGDARPDLRSKTGVDPARHQFVLPNRAAGKEAHREGVTGQFGEHFGRYRRVDAARAPQPTHFAQIGRAHV